MPEHEAVEVEALLQVDRSTGPREPDLHLVGGQFRDGETQLRVMPLRIEVRCKPLRV